MESLILLILQLKEQRKLATDRIVLAILTFISILAFTSCNIAAGTLGGFETWHFSIPRAIIDMKIDSLYSSHPEYKIPEKWRYLDNWNERGFGFLKGKILYLADPPEEMYYFSYIAAGTGDENPEDARLSIRAINSGVSWLKKDDISKEESRRVENRFYSELIFKLEKSTKVRAKIDKQWYE